MHLQDGMYSDAIDSVIEGLDGSGLPVIQNELSNRFAVQFPSGSTVVGKVNIIEQNRIIWFLYYPSDGSSEIGETQNVQDCRKFVNDSEGFCDDCQSPVTIEKAPLETITQLPCSHYRKIQKGICLAPFPDKNPINKIEYRLLPCSLQIFWAQNGSQRRWLEFDYQNGDSTMGLIIQSKFYEITGTQNPPCNDPIYSTNLDCNKLSVQPNVAVPCIEFVGLSGGGSLIAGDYQFFIGFSDNKSNKLSSYFSATNPIPVRTQDVALITNYKTDRSIVLNIDNLDFTSPFQYYNLVVAKTIDNVTSFYLVGTFPVTQNKFVYTGNNPSEIVLTESDVLVGYPYYTGGDTVGQSNGILYWANVNETIKANFQRVANKIILNWQTIAIPEAAYRDPKNTVKYRSGMRDEVYPYGVQFLFDTGEETNGYHIPGRVAKSSDLVIINNNDVFVNDPCSGTTNTYRWQVYNTATVLGGDLSIYDGCNESCYQYGEFAYWESTRTYPNDPLVWGELCGQPIRHHKYPDSVISHIHNRQNATLDPSGGTFAENNIVFPIGVKVDPDSVRTAISDAVTASLITQADADRIIGYRIVRGNRFGHKSVIAKGLVYDVNQYQRIDSDPPSGGPSVIDQEPIYFANYPYNDLRPNSFITNDFQAYAVHDQTAGADLPFTFSNRYTFHSPDTKFNQPGLGTELKLETVEYGQSQGSYNIAQNQAKQKLLSTASYSLALSLGLVRALTQIQPVEEIDYTIRSDYKTTQSDSTISSATFDTGQNISGTGTTTITTINGGGSIGQHTETNPDKTESHNQITGTNAYAFSTGLPTLPTDASDSPVSGVDDWQRKTYKNTFNQYYSVGSSTLLPPSLAPLGSIIGFLGQVPAYLNLILQEMNIILDLIKAFTAYRDWCIQYESVGKYNCYKTVANDAGVKRRALSVWAYMDGNNQTISEPVNPITGQFDSIKFNNWNREDSVYLKYSGVAFPDAGTSSSIQDESRSPITCNSSGANLNVRFTKPISAYYASIKNYVADQYGSVFDIEYLHTDSCYFPISQSPTQCRGVYGGDVFINRFAFKTKVPYYFATTFKLPNGTEFDYTAVTNLAYPRNYYNNTGGFDVNNLTDLFNPTNVISLLGRPKSYRACQTQKFFYQNGYIYLYHYGIPYFLVESDYNTDYRYATNNLEGDFYPHQSDLDFWMQEINVPIAEPNTYFYNNTYSKQNHEAFIGIDPLSFIPGRKCDVDHPNRIIYSDGPNWLVYKANNFYDYPLNKGRIVAIDGIENETVLVRSVNNTSIFKSILRLQVDGQTSQVGNGGVFANPPQDLATTTLGYLGSQHVAMLSTEYGHITVDAKRGQVFNIHTGGAGADEISKNGMKNWFKENLPFRVLRDFPNYPEESIDNAFNGAGITMSFDKRFNRIIITKKDWKKKDTSVQYDPILNSFYKFVGPDRIEIALGEKPYFTDCSWTVSYNFYTQSWTSFHSYKPNYYIDFIDFFGSGINDVHNGSGYWVHNLYNGSFQVFYGKLFPFLIEPVVKFNQQLSQLNSVEFDTEVRRYNNEFDYAIKKFIPGFNKAIIYNDHYNSGYLNLTKVDKNDFTQVGKYPKKNLDSWDIAIAIANYKWRFNQFYSLNRDNSDVPLWIFDGNNEEKSLNQRAFNYVKSDYNLPRLKGQWFKQRLVNDQWSNYKIIYKFSINEQTSQIR